MPDVIVPNAPVIPPKVDADPNVIVIDPSRPSIVKGSGLFNTFKNYGFLPEDEKENTSPDNSSNTPPPTNGENNNGNGKPTVEPPAELPPSKLEEMDVPRLIEEVKKNQTIGNERLGKITELEKQLTELKGGELNPTLKKFVDSLKKDVAGAFRQFKDELQLPDLDTVRDVVVSDMSAESRLTQWQQSELIPSIEAKFKMEKGEFDPDDTKGSHSPGSPAYMYRTQTEKKEKELFNETQSIQQTRSMKLKEAQDRQTEDIKFIADTHFSGDQAKGSEWLAKLNDVYKSIEKGETPISRSPFEVRNLIRGVFYDEFSKMDVDKAVAETIGKIKNQLATLGIQLPGDELGIPKDISKIKGEGATPPLKREGNMNSPLFNQMNRFVS